MLDKPHSHLKSMLDTPVAQRMPREIAPGYGCVLRGRKVVARHYRMLDEFLKACDKSVAVSRYVSRDEER